MIYIEYYSATRKEDILPFSIAWMDPEHIIQVRKVKQRMPSGVRHHLFMESKKAKLVKKQSIMVVTV